MVMYVGKKQRIFILLTLLTPINYPYILFNQFKLKNDGLNFDAFALNLPYIANSTTIIEHVGFANIDCIQLLFGFVTVLIVLFMIPMAEIHAVLTWATWPNKN